MDIYSVSLNFVLFICLGIFLQKSAHLHVGRTPLLIHILMGNRLSSCAGIGASVFCLLMVTQSFSPHFRDRCRSVVVGWETGAMLSPISHIIFLALVLSKASSNFFAHLKTFPLSIAVWTHHTLPSHVLSCCCLRKEAFCEGEVFL